jgi:DNA-binding LytR/AlgR family response regulator
MNAIIIEDEQLAARRLKQMVLTHDPSIEILAILESVSESVEWLTAHPKPDLIFLDIHLEDGLSFAIFDKVKVDVPIIFTTAYDEYAIKAFKLKSIDYLLKPIVQEELGRALDKFRDWGANQQQMVDVSELYKMMALKDKAYRERFSVTVGQKLKTIDVEDIAYFFSTSGITFVVMQAKNQYSLDMSLDSLVQELDPSKFFRVNRQYLVGLPAIAQVHIFPKSKLKLELAPPGQEDVFVSLDKVPDFKKWLDGGR